MRRRPPNPAARRAALQCALDRIVALLADHSGVERVIVFGSFARGDARAGSDLDLIIVQKTDKRFLDRLDEMYRLLVPEVACDILVYTPEEFARLRHESRFVARAAREGKVVHAA